MLAIDSELPETGNGTRATGAASLSFNFTNAAGTLLLVGACTSHAVPGGPVTSGVTYDSAALTKDGALVFTSNRNEVSLWKKDSPATGTKQVVITGSTTIDCITGLAMSLSGVDATSTKNSTSASGSSSTPSLTPSSAPDANNEVVGICGSGSDATATGEHLSSRTTIDVSFSAGNLQMTRYTGSGSNRAMSETLAASDSWGMILTEVVKDAAPSAAPSRAGRPLVPSFF